jgi:FkbM family methyltransferase
MLRERLIDAATRLGIDDQLRTIRATLVPGYRYARDEGQHLRELLKSVLKEDSNCIDIGAFRGRVLAEIMRVAPRGCHIAYEPLPHLHRYLVERFPSVDIRQAAVSNVSGETSFTYVKNVAGRSGMREISYPKQPQIETLTVRTETLDSSLPGGYIPSLIKIDVEGAERLVIEGAINTISKYKPVVMFEHGKGSAVHYGTQPHHIYELLHNESGLRIFDLDGNGPYSLGQFEESFAQDDRWDYIARP